MLFNLFFSSLGTILKLLSCCMSCADIKRMRHEHADTCTCSCYLEIEWITLCSSSGRYCLPGAPGESGQAGAQGPPGAQGFPGFKGQC